MPTDTAAPPPHLPPPVPAARTTTSAAPSPSITSPSPFPPVGPPLSAAPGNTSSSATATEFTYASKLPPDHPGLRLDRAQPRTLKTGPAIAATLGLVGAGALAVAVATRSEVRAKPVDVDPVAKTVPTTASRSVAQLSVAERGVYDLICRRYIAQFYPPFEYHQTTIDLLVTGELFRATGRTPIADGWKPVFGAEIDDQADTVDPADGELSTAPLPSLQQGASVRAGPPVTIIDRKTTPPKRFTDATLIQAMKGIARFVVDPAIKKLLHETDGIGTPATQAAIIQTLYDRRFIEKQRSHIVSTVVGRALISTLPAVATTPDMTALWEAALRRISQGEMPSLAFLQRVRDQLVELVTRGRAVGALSVPGVSLRPCPAPGCTGSLRQRRGKTESFWACTRYPDCKFTENGTPPTTANANPSSRPSRRARRSRAARP
jgi:hypothetical protein